MIRITFKNVGQGDSIILEWKKSRKKKIGIIDCKKNLGSNPILDYIKEKEIKEISFLILSHPHLDHFSGFAELIEHCIKNKVKIKYFLHTANNTPSYWKAAVDSKEAETEILRLFNIIRDANSTGMKSHPIQADTINPDINLDDEYFLKFIAPTSIHLYNYARNFDTPPFEEETGNKPNANWLATVIKIYSKKHDGYILLTSDAKKETMFYDKKKDHNNSKSKLIIGQCPHHGAEGNFKNSFWKLINHEKNTPIVISVGTNIYGEMLS